MIPPLAQVNTSGTFNVPVTVEQCLLPQTNGAPDADEYTLHKFDPVQQGPVVELADVQELHVVCSSFAYAHQTPVQYFASGLRRGIQRIFALPFDPPPLYAAHRGLGGLTSSFSDVSWAKSALLSVDSGDGQTANEFTTIQVSTLLETLHPQNAPSAGQPVTFTVTGGGGTVGPGQQTSFVVNTDASGIATVNWNLGAAGSNPQTLEATSVTDDPPVVFTATATPAFVALVTCPVGSGGDQVFRGFYLPTYPGTTLDQVDLWFAVSGVGSSPVGTYTMALTARAGGFGGTVIGTNQLVLNLSTFASPSTLASFLFPSPAVSPSSTVAFEISIVSGPGSIVFYDVPPTGDPGCPILQTNGTASPLDTFRRQGVRATIFGAPAAPPIP